MMSSKRPAATTSFQKKKKKPRQSSLLAFASKNDGKPIEVVDLTSNDDEGLTSSATRRSSDLSGGIHKNSPRYKIYCDLDGVLVDFDAGVRKIFNGKGADDLPPKVLWSRVGQANKFFENLPWTSDGKELWTELIKQHNNDNNCKHTTLPDILTGVPMQKSARAEKYRWCKREFQSIGVGSKNYDSDDTTDSECDDNGASQLPKISVNHVDMTGRGKQSHSVTLGSRKKHAVNVITCWSKNKHFESRPGAVLIDDREKFAEEWERKGGIFIHHTSTSATLEKLRSHGILEEPATTTTKRKISEEDSSTTRTKKVKVSLKESASTQKSPDGKTDSIPFLMMTVGIPGSGKSTFAKTLESENPFKYVRINQDELKSRIKCESLCRRTLESGKVPIIDRCNISAEQRQYFLNIAREKNISVDCVVFQHSEKECIKRCEQRMGHPSVHKSNAKKTVSRMAQAFAPPKPDGSDRSYNNVTYVTSFEEADTLALKYLNKTSVKG